MRRPNAYDFQINAAVPGSLDYLANESVFTTNATKNSPGVKVWGTPGNVSGTGSSVAKYAGIYEYFCIYHVALGMFGYLIVLLNSAYSGGQSSSESASTSATAASALQISIVQSASTNTNSAGFLGNSARVVVILRSKSLSVPICFLCYSSSERQGGLSTVSQAYDPLPVRGNLQMKQGSYIVSAITQMLAMDEEKKEGIMHALLDPYSRKILLSTIEKGKSAEEIAQQNNIPMSTCYRRVHELLGSEALKQEEIVLTKEDKKSIKYRSAYRSVEVTLGPGEFAILAVSNRSADEKLLGMWSSIRKQAKVGGDDQEPFLRVRLENVVLRNKDAILGECDLCQSHKVLCKTFNVGESYTTVFICNKCEKKIPAFAKREERSENLVTA